MYHRVKQKTKKSHSSEVKALILLLFAFVLGYCYVVPDKSGLVGSAIAKFSFLILGQSAFLIPIVFAFLSANYAKEIKNTRLEIIFSLSAILSLSVFLSLFGLRFYGAELGGTIGAHLNPFFSRLFGATISLFIASVLFVFFAAKMFKIPLKSLIVDFYHKIIEDFNEWKIENTEHKKIVAEQKKIRVEKKQAQKVIPALFPSKEPKIITRAAPSPATKKAVPEFLKDAKIFVSKGSSQVKYILPDISLLSDDPEPARDSSEDHKERANNLIQTLKHFDIDAYVDTIVAGPVVTRYDLSLAPGVKVQEIVSLSDNIGLSMKSPSLRVVPIPEKSLVGIEVPNKKSNMVGLKGVLTSLEAQDSKSVLSLALGKTTDGTPYVSDLAAMPHLLVAGATGSGKSVGIHSMILSILFRARPDEVKFLIIDPKRVEMPLYRKLPHLYDPRTAPENADIITRAKDASESLKRLVTVMESRYEKYAKETVRNIEGYNEKMESKGGEKDFYIVVIIDELADLMSAASKEIEEYIQRLAQMARAVGIHLILATQRPSVNVITGVIKANFPARIAFQTTSKVDSRVILDAIGADSLLGKGDMLFMPPGESRLARIQGAFVSAKDAEKVVNFIAAQNVPKHYEFQSTVSQGASPLGMSDDKEIKELSQALTLVRERKRVSQDLLKAHFGSSARATNILSLMEIKGFIGKPEGTNRWTIYFDKIDEYFDQTAGVVNGQ